MSKIEKIKEKLRNCKPYQTVTFNDVKAVAKKYDIQIVPAKGSHYKMIHPLFNAFANQVKGEIPQSNHLTIPLKSGSYVSGLYVADLIKFIDYLESEND